MCVCMYTYICIHILYICKYCLASSSTTEAIYIHIYLWLHSHSVYSCVTTAFCFNIKRKPQMSGSAVHDPSERSCLGREREQLIRGSCRPTCLSSRPDCSTSYLPDTRQFTSSVCLSLPYLKNGDNNSNYPLSFLWANEPMPVKNL